MENTNQFITLSAAEMLALWKQQLHLEPTRRDCVIEREDGIDLDAWLSTKIDIWYASLLLNQPYELLPVEDVKNDVMLSVNNNGIVIATLPQHCARPVEWQLSGWQRSVTQFLNPADAEARVLFNTWTQPCSHNPAIIDYGNRLLLFSRVGNSAPQLVLARCVVRPSDGSFTLHRSLLETIPTEV